MKTVKNEVWADAEGNPVPFGHERGRTVLYGAGARISEEDADRLGIETEEDNPEEQSSDAPSAVDEEKERLAARIKELEDLIGQPPADSHPDEALPRAATWHGERATWADETQRLRDFAAGLEKENGQLKKTAEQIEQSEHRRMEERDAALAENEALKKRVAELEAAAAKPAEPGEAQGEPTVQPEATATEGEPTVKPTGKSVGAAPDDKAVKGPDKTK